jgi:23S rRNA G2445 N2-methylase RlmL
MTKPRPNADVLPPCYAVVHPGLETVAGEEISKDLRGTVKRTAFGLVVFRVPEVDESLLRLRTVEDVFLLAWGTDRLTYRAEDLDKIQRWTAKDADWPLLLRLHHAIRPKPKGKPTYRLVTQMTGTHGYRRIDAGKALARGLAGKVPASWREAEENAALEIWLTIHGATAVCGVRLSDRTMRHRTYKEEHRAASLRPTIAAAMVRLAGAEANQVVLDPMCGAGTILAEQLAVAWKRGAGAVRVWGGDRDASAVRSAAVNLRRLGEAHLARWDATRLPLPDRCVDRIVSNPPFGKQLGRLEEIGPLYRRALVEYDRVLGPGGRAVFLIGDPHLLKEAALAVRWQTVRKIPVRVLGQQAAISVWRKEGQSDTMSR